MLKISKNNDDGNMIHRLAESSAAKNVRAIMKITFCFDTARSIASKKKPDKCGKNAEAHL